MGLEGSKRGLFIVFILLLFMQTSYGQTVKTGVLVIGSGDNALGAGFQSAKSGVKTIVLLDREDFELSESEALNKNRHSGLEAEFMKRMRATKGIKDNGTVYVDHTSANVVLKAMADSTKNLMVFRKQDWAKLKRSGGGWSVQLNDGRTLKAQVLVNADASGKVNKALLLPKMKDLQWKKLTYEDNIYRSSVTSGFAVGNCTGYIISMYDLLIPGQENLVVMNPEQESIAGGQAGGAVAAYAVFFKTKTSLSNLKSIQGELISHKLDLIPFADIADTDTNRRSIQFMGLSGFLKGLPVQTGLNFQPDQLVRTEEIKEPIKSYYYKAQIWFDDHKEKEMTIAATLDLVCRVGNKSLENTTAEVKKKWKTVYHLATDFDPERAVTRREFALLVTEYLRPFDVNIDAKGRVLR